MTSDLADAVESDEGHPLFVCSLITFILSSWLFDHLHTNLIVECDESYPPVGVLFDHLLQLMVHSGLYRLEARHVCHVASLTGEILIGSFCVQGLVSCHRPAKVNSSWNLPEACNI